MELINRFREFCKDRLALRQSDELLVGISGGRDSVLLATLLHQAGFKIALAHVNFQLRDKESDEDELFVKGLAEKWSVPFHLKRIDTLKYKKQRKLSIQEAARDIRYQWFQELLLQYKMSFVAVAHHKDDVLETQLINLSRGTGLKGLRSIQAKRDEVIRPLLCFTRDEVDVLVKELNILFREDSSNASDDYLRNKMRHHVIPALKECEPKVVEQAVRSSEMLLETENVLETLLLEKRGEIFEKLSDTTYKISIEKLNRCSASLLHFLFDPFGGFLAKEVQQLMVGQTGKFLENKIFSLLRNRDHLVLTNRTEFNFDKLLINDAGAFQLNDNVRLNVEVVQGVEEIGKLSKDQCFIPADKIEFPLTVRKWEQGDWFVPFGMKGRKLVSDFLTDLKLDKFGKEKVLVLTHQQDIIWLVGLRSDDRYKVVDTSEKLYLFALK